VRLSTAVIPLIEKLQRFIELLTLIILMQLERQSVDTAKLKAAEARAAALEAQLAAAKKNSRNSSKPPSSDIVKAPRPRRRGKRKIGGQKGHPRYERVAFTPEEISHFVSCRLASCPCCDSRDLSPDESREPRVFDQIELPAKLFEVSRHTAYASRCGKCGTTAYAEVPAAVRKLGLLGPRMTSMLLYTKGALHVSYSGLEDFLGQVIGVDVCRGYLAKTMKRASPALAVPVQELRDLLPDQPWLNVDETGHKENGQPWWTWVFRAPQFVVFSIQEQRSSAVLLKILGQEFDGILGCDYFSAYRKYMRLTDVRIQFCLAHLIRDLKFLAEHPDGRIQLYGQPILKAVKRLFALIHQHEQTPLADLQQRLDRQKHKIIEAALNTAIISPNREEVRAHCKPVINMAERFRQHGEAYFTFLTTPGVQPTNNSAEQAFRFVVIDRHVTQGTRGSTGRAFCERIWTLIGTCRLQKRSIFQFLSEAVSAWAQGLPAPSLVPANTG
jgi:transposase